jgi:8-oxo-dGTP diphosphatase
MKTPALHSVVALFAHPSQAGLVLAVSRKTDHEDLGLPGGKIEPGETDKQALVREVFEETGVRVLEAKPIFERPCGPGVSRCFHVTRWEGDPASLEGARVAWVAPVRLLEARNSFHAYNHALFSHLGPSFFYPDRA